MRAFFIKKGIQHLISANNIKTVFTSVSCLVLVCSETTPHLSVRDRLRCLRDGFLLHILLNILRFISCCGLMLRFEPASQFKLR